MAVNLAQRLIARSKQIEPFAFLYDVYDAHRRYRQSFGRWPNVVRPTRFQEWIQHRKLFDRRPEFVRFADKLAMRDYIRERTEEDVLTHVYAVYEQAEQFDSEVLPAQFVIKGSSGWRQNIFVRDRAQLDLVQARTVMRRWSGENYYAVSREYAYKRVQRRAYAEELMLSADGGLTWDYKVNCFAGQPFAIQVFSDRNGTSYTKARYDCDWQRLPADVEGDRRAEYPRPATLEQMLRVAAALSAGFDYLRVDLYEHDGRVVVGELTFHPGNGFAQLVNEEYCLLLGRRWAAARQELRRH